VADQQPSFDFRPVKTTEPAGVRTAIRVAFIALWLALLATILLGIHAVTAMSLTAGRLAAVAALTTVALLVMWMVLGLLVVVVWTPENRFTLRSLILTNIFVGTLIGFVVRGGFRPDAGRAGPPEFWLAALFFAAAVTSLVLDERRWREMKQRRTEDEDDDGPAGED